MKAKSMGVRLTSYMGAELMMAIHKDRAAMLRSKPITISLPVNLRNYYPSETTDYKKLYEEAIEEYDKALDSNIPWEDACWVRINKVLSMTAPIIPEELTLDNIDDTIDLLKNCLDVLSEDDCATEDGDGHDEDAQQLYDDITEWIEELEKQKEEMEQEQEEEEDD